MADYADRFAEKQEDKLAFKIKAIYKDAAKDIQKKYEAWERNYRQQDAHMRGLLSAGKIDDEAYRKWQKEEVFKGKIWQQKLHDMTQIYVNADEKARQLLSGTQKNVFVEAANYTAYDVDQHVGGGVAFTLYDKNTVDRMLRNDPKMLPEWKINEKKDYNWNERRVQNAITQGIIQGESIPAIGKRLTEELGASNSKQMTMFARTAMTGAHNAGRMERLHEAQDMGIEVKKQWLAAKDDKVRDTHEYLNGQVVDVDEPFTVDGMEIMFPGDPSAPPELTYNCRCTMVYVYPKYQKNVSTKNTQPYEEWKAQKQPEQQIKSTSTLDIFKQKKVSYVPAQSLQEAEEALSQYVDTSGFGALGVSYKGISLDVANEINSALIPLQETFDVSKFGGIVAPAGNTKLGKQIQGAVAGWSPIRKSYVLNRDTLKTIKVAEAHFSKEKFYMTDILTHPENYNLDKASSAFRRMLEHSRISGRGTVPESVSEAIYHEFGHSVESIVGKSPHWGEIKSSMPKYAPKISGYAQESVSEYIAESMASYLKGEDIIDPTLRDVFDSMRRE